eukprot:TRINITY_DN71061_c0_g1_i1.p3 TRINITY_DN71061_c0_g1~~TRINITY_DN71061_c0_g1_i1.p3  ORF type:complete len:186 (-),score=71.50 TRINITY_DN71061_c0_g1_i1:572-1129(-)
MKKLLCILGLACLMILPAGAWAQTQPDAKERAQRLQAASDYWELTHTHDRIIETLQKVSAQLPPDKRKGFVERAKKYFGPKRMAELKKQWLEMAAGVFTAKELKALVSFYGSEEGKAIREKMPNLLEGNAKIVGGQMTAFIKEEQSRLAREDAAAAQKKAPAKEADKTKKKQARPTCAPAFRRSG